MAKKKVTMNWKEAQRRLNNGRCNAKKVERFIDGDFAIKYRPTIGGIWVKAGSGDEFAERSDALAAARQVQQHWRDKKSGIKLYKTVE